MLVEEEKIYPLIENMKSNLSVIKSANFYNFQTDGYEIIKEEYLKNRQKRGNAA